MVAVWIVGLDVIELERFKIRKNRARKDAVGF